MQQKIMISLTIIIIISASLLATYYFVSQRPSLPEQSPTPPIEPTPTPTSTTTQPTSTQTSTATLSPTSTATPTPSPSSTQTPSPTPEPTPTPLDGAQLYASNCAVCHNPLESSTRKGRTATQIQNAINNVSLMQSLSNLTPEQIQAIADALNQ